MAATGHGASHCYSLLINKPGQNDWNCCCHLYVWLLGYSVKCLLCLWIKKNNFK